MTKDNQNKIIPKHVAIIMDGNRRWAKEKGLPEFEGHRRGEQCIEPIIDRAIELGVSHLTFWAFSTENWRRSKIEVAFLLQLYRKNLDRKVNIFHKKNVKVHVIGNTLMFPGAIQEKTKEWMEKTKKNTGMVLNLALSYGGRDEIVRAIEKVRASSKFKNPNSKLTAEEFSTFLDTSGQPDVDLLIRTGGDMRLSGFLLWQMEYAELYFTKIFWPAFTPNHFTLALRDFANRKRRFGR